MVSFDQLVKSQRKEEIPSAVLALDPGETTGWAFFNKAVLKATGELKATDIGTVVPQLENLFKLLQPQVLVVEDYRIYSWKTKQHAFSDVFTLRLIGCIETLAVQNQIPLYKQSAQVAKNFCTDSKLQEWDIYVTGNHIRDAVRHGAYFLIFNEH